MSAMHWEARRRQSMLDRRLSSSKQIQNNPPQTEPEAPSEALKDSPVQPGMWKPMCQLQTYPCECYSIQRKTSKQIQFCAVHPAVVRTSGIHRSTSTPVVSTSLVLPALSSGPEKRL
ncbi:hypothetical protein AALO_G00079610 [Alosa alosa]|uniref:Uncharacterized protein n=1 Tax=Alosa alosa TaxID=278164 RepID=A0AAV6H1H0_9TELE|nr:hypothetical protein AALO_G00079610 [Alosa alosa]